MPAATRYVAAGIPFRARSGPPNAQQGMDMLGLVGKVGAAVICLATLVLAIASDAAEPQAPTVLHVAPSLLTARAPTLPSPASALALIRYTLLAVDQANKTGNYTVVRDISGPDFQDANDPARLAQIFAPLRAQGVDMFVVAVTEPLYKEPPRITAKRMLYVAGQFPTTPHRINFELLFEVVRGQWRIYGISITPA
jgi:hypothetical protein